MEYFVMASTGIEDNAAPAWMLVDDADSVLNAVPLQPGDSYADGVARLKAAGIIPADAEIVDREPTSYPWTPRDLDERLTLAAGGPQ
ncbi:hypothetical protein [Micromonospora zhanjiangensis]|uniref:Uncharacterized protein n=1 Tax=Micromonospora zhanjiangensis TaxID=1522057 RepID=A0ABV8KPA8_9ACTN